MSELETEIKALESESRVFIPSNNYVIIRLDGRGFSKFTKSFKKPFDEHFTQAMIDGAVKLARDFNPLLVYTQSDEVTMVLPPNHGLFNGRTDKLLSLAAASMSVAFTLSLIKHYPHIEENAPMFDARVMVTHAIDIATKAVLWRHMDCIKNSVSMFAHEKFGHSELHGKNTATKRSMLIASGTPWEDLPSRLRYGTLVSRTSLLVDVSDTIPEQYRPTEPVYRRRYGITDFGSYTSGFIRDVIKALTLPKK